FGIFHRRHLLGRWSPMNCYVFGKRASQTSGGSARRVFCHRRRSPSREPLVVGQFESAPREIPRPAGENAGLRDDAFGIGVELSPPPGLLTSISRIRGC